MASHKAEAASRLDQLCLAALILLWTSAHAAPPSADTRSPEFWVYSLVGTDYDGYKMLPYFLQHYRGLGVEDSHFHFDLLHDPAEPAVGLQVCRFAYPIFAKIFASLGGQILSLALV